MTLFAVSALNWLLSLAIDIPVETMTTLLFGLLVLVLGLPVTFMLLRPIPIPGNTEGYGQPESPVSSRWSDGRPSVDYGWKEAVRGRDFWMLVLGAGFLGAANQITRTLIFGLADYRFHVEGSYRMFESLHEVVSVSFILVGGLIGNESGAASGVTGFCHAPCGRSRGDPAGEWSGMAVCGDPDNGSRSRGRHRPRCLGGW